MEKLLAALLARSGPRRELARMVEQDEGQRPEIQGPLPANRMPTLDPATTYNPQMSYSERTTQDRKKSLTRDKGTQSKNQKSSPDVTPTPAYETAAQRAQEFFSDDLSEASNLQEMLKLRLQHSNPQINLKPTLALVDAWTGSKLADSYDAPESADERSQAIVKLKAAVDASKLGVKKQMADFARNQLLSKLTTTLGYNDKTIDQVVDSQGTQKGTTLGTGKGGRSVDPSILSTRLQTLWKGYEGVRGDTESLEASKDILRLSNSPQSWVTDKMTVLGMVKSGKLTPVSNLDVRSLSGGPGFFQQLQALEAKIFRNQNLTEMDRVLVNKWARASAEQIAKRLEQRSEDFLAGNAEDFFGYDKTRSKIRPGSGWGADIPAAKKSIADRILEAINQPEAPKNGK